RLYIHHVDGYYRYASREATFSDRQRAPMSLPQPEVGHGEPRRSGNRVGLGRVEAGARLARRHDGFLRRHAAAARRRRAASMTSQFSRRTSGHAMIRAAWLAVKGRAAPAEARRASAGEG